MHKGRRHLNLEDFWLRLDGFQEIVLTAWHSVHDNDPFRRLTLRLQATARALTSWSAPSVGNVRQKIAITRELTLRFDTAQETRALSPSEQWLHKQLKVVHLGLASLERTIARQRAHCRARRWRRKHGAISPSVLLQAAKDTHPQSELW